MTPAWSANYSLIRAGVLIVAAGGSALAIGYLVTEQPALALVAALSVLVMGASITQPALLPILAMPLIVVVVRVGGGGVDLTLSDLVLGIAFWPAVLLSPRPFSRELRQLLWLNAIYQAATLLTVVANPFLANAVEWLHAWMLISGALIVGWAVGRAGMAKAGLTLFLLACIGLAIFAVAEGAIQWVGGNFAPLYPSTPWPMHKNFLGSLILFAAVLAYAHPPWMGWSRRWAMATFWLFVGAISLTQSRQAILGLGVALLIISFRTAGERRRSNLALLSILPAGYLVATVIRDQVASGNEHNSIYQRLSWFSDTLALWRESPFLGHGLRYWTSGRTEFGFQPPNGLLEVLASAGVIGLFAFVVMLGGTMVILWRVDPNYGTVAFAVIVGRLVQSQFDLFWISITASVPLAIAGIALGALSHSQQHGRFGSTNSVGGTPTLSTEPQGSMVR